jgi:hypothetical protein
MAEVTGTIGNDQVELKNAATESTLRALLGEMQKMTGSIIQSNKGNTGGTGPGAALAQAAGGAKGLAGAAASAVTKLHPLARAASILGGLLGDLAASASKTLGNLVDFGEGLINGKGRVSDLMGAFKDLPLGLGAVAGMFQKIMQIQEQELDTYRTLVTNGVSFGGQLGELRLTALSLGMSLDEFAGFVKKNSDAFYMMGGTVNEGAQRFVKLGRALKDSNIGSELLGMGFTFEQLQSNAAEYIRVTGGRTAKEMQNTDALIRSAGNYMKELDLMAQITGKSREEIEKQLQEQAKNAAWQNYLSTLDEKGREKANAALLESLTKGGKGAADALQAKMLGLPNLSEEGQLFEALGGKARYAIDAYADAIKDNKKDLDDVHRATGQLVVGLSDEGEKFGTQFGGALLAQGDAVGKFTAAALNANTEIKNKGVKNAEDYKVKVIDAAAAEQKKRAASEAAQAAESEKQFKQLAESLYAALLPAIKELAPTIRKLATEFGEFAKNHMEDLKSALHKVAHFVSNMFSASGRQENIDDISKFIADVVKGIFKNLFGPSAEDLQAQGQQKKEARVQNKVNDAMWKNMAAEQLATTNPNATTADINALAEKLKQEAASKGEGRANTTVGATGNLFENFGSGKTMTLHGIEGVFKPEQIGYMLAEQSKAELTEVKKSITAAAASGGLNVDSLVTELQTLNKQTAEMIRYLRLTHDETRQFVPSIRSLYGNLYV